MPRRINRDRCPTLGVVSSLAIVRIIYTESMIARNSEEKGGKKTWKQPRERVQHFTYGGIFSLATEEDVAIEPSSRNPPHDTASRRRTRQNESTGERKESVRPETV